MAELKRHKILNSMYPFSLNVAVWKVSRTGQKSEKLKEKVIWYQKLAVKIITNH